MSVFVWCVLCVHLLCVREVVWCSVVEGEKSLILVLHHSSIKFFFSSFISYYLISFILFFRFSVFFSFYGFQNILMMRVWRNGKTILLFLFWHSNKSAQIGLFHY